jgi:methylenetetrahydrofolate dehydrogenase (NADP+)/methenyltetrahydrofolate cyclohydrolase
MSAQIIDGKAIAQKVRDGLKLRVDGYKAEGSRAPSLAVVLVGDDPASQVYVGHKEKACANVGIKSVAHKISGDTNQADLEALLTKLSDDDEIDGILLQLPLPKHLNSDRALDCIKVTKDVDGLSPLNQGLLTVKKDGLFSCTPLGCMELIRSTGVEISGKRAVVIGRSILVGTPVATMLTHANATVTVIHSRTVAPEEIVRNADILVVAAGQHHMVDDTWIKPGAVVIDVGMHRIDGKLAGDVQFDKVKEVAGFVTPVPGGVGPMTIAMLLSNCLTAYEGHRA